MADQWVQQNSATGTTTANFSLPSVVNPNAIGAFLWDGSTTTPAVHTVADGQATYTALGTPVTDSTNLIWAGMFGLQNATAGSHSITGTLDSGAAVFLVASEVQSQASGAFLGQAGADQNNPGTAANALSSGTISGITGNNATVLAMSADVASASTSDEPTVGTSPFSFTSRANNANATMGAWRLESAAASANGAATATAITGTHQFVTLGMAILNAAGAAVVEAVTTLPTRMRLSPLQINRSLFQYQAYDSGPLGPQAETNRHDIARFVPSPLRINRKLMWSDGADSAQVVVLEIPAQFLARFTVAPLRALRFNTQAADDSTQAPQVDTESHFIGDFNLAPLFRLPLLGMNTAQDQSAAQIVDTPASWIAKFSSAPLNRYRFNTQAADDSAPLPFVDTPVYSLARMVPVKLLRVRFNHSAADDSAPPPPPPSGQTIWIVNE